ncbi:MAG: FeoA family protein, partial [Chloroflexota bacterium]|jgi:hypothetical protein
VLPGTIVEAELVGPGGDPTGYRIRDTLIAFRREQADMIRIKKVQAEPAPAGKHPDPGELAAENNNLEET